MATIRKRTLPSGKTAWLAGYRDGAGQRRFKQFATRREADDYLVAVRSAVAAGTHSPDRTSLTVKAAGALWIARCERDGLEETTLRQYRTHLRLHIEPFIGATKLSRLTVPAVNAFADQIQAAGRSREMTKRVLASLSAIVSEAQRRGLVATNTVRDASPIKRSKRADVRPVMPTRDELRAILEASKGRWRPLFMAALFTGLRASELRGLPWDDVDLRAGILHVRRRVDEFNRFGPPKSEAGTRDIPISPTLLSTLKAWKLACPLGELKLVFPNGAGKVERLGNILRRGFWPTQVAAGVIDMVEGTDAAGRATKVPDARYSLHALRHAAAALWIEQGLSAKRIQTLMGHASIQQTFDRYGYLFEARDDDKSAMAGVEIGLVR